MPARERNPSPTTRMRAASGPKSRSDEDTAPRASSKSNQGSQERPANVTPKRPDVDRRVSRNQPRGPSPSQPGRSTSGRNHRAGTGDKHAPSPKIDNETLLAYKAMRVPSDEQGQFDMVSKMQLEIKRLARELDETRAQKITIEAGKNDLIAENANMKKELSNILSNQKYKNHTIKMLERKIVELRARLETERSSFIMHLAENNSKNTTPGFRISSRSPRRQSPRPSNKEPPSPTGPICDKCKDKIRSGQYPAGSVPLRAEDGSLGPQDYKLPDLHLKEDSPRPESQDFQVAAPNIVIPTDIDNLSWKKEFDHLKKENEALRGELEALTAIQNDGHNQLEVIQKMNEDLDRVLEERSALQQDVAYWKAQYELANAQNVKHDTDQNVEVCSKEELLACQALNAEINKKLAATTERLRFSEEQLKLYAEVKNREKALIENVTSLRTQLQDMTKRVLAYEQQKTPKSARAKSNDNIKKPTKPSTKK